MLPRYMDAALIHEGYPSGTSSYGRDRGLEGTLKANLQRPLFPSPYPCRREKKNQLKVSTQQNSAEGQSDNSCCLETPESILHYDKGEVERCGRFYGRTFCPVSSRINCKKRGGSGFPKGWVPCIDGCEHVLGEHPLTLLHAKAEARDTFSGAFYPQDLGLAQVCSPCQLHSYLTAAPNRCSPVYRCRESLSASYMGHVPVEKWTVGVNRCVSTRSALKYLRYRT